MTSEKKMETAVFLETMVTTYTDAWCHGQLEQTLIFHRRGNFNPYPANVENMVNS